MHHVLVSSEDAALVERLRAAAPPSTTFLAVEGVDETLERLARSFRVDAIVTDDPEVERAIREEIPGAVPVHLVGEGETADDSLAALELIGAG